MKNLFALGISFCLTGFPLGAATVAHYEFNGSGTATIGSVITDATGSHHGTVAGGDLQYGSDPLVGSYLSFTATQDRVVISGAPGFLFSTEGAYTIEVIFRTTMTTDIGSLISKNTSTSNPDSQWWLRYQGGGQLRGLIEGDGNATEDSATSSAATPVNNGQWQRVALVFNGTISPKRLDIFINGVLSGSDVSIGTLGTIGGAEADPVIIGEFASLAANRAFVGDIAAVRLSDTALTPAEFLQISATYVTDFTPTNNASFLPASTVASFAVKSPTIGVDTTNIFVSLNGVDVSSQLTFGGSAADRTVALPALSANRIYDVEILIVDRASNQIPYTTSFNTFSENLVFIEGEDYNFEGGQFIDNPQLDSNPGPNNYLDRFGYEGIDYHQTNTPAVTQYRIGDQVGTAVSQDALRQDYIDAIAINPGIADYMARDHANSEWLNYTRTFPANTYRVYARVAKAGTVPIVMHLDEVTSGSTGTSQTLAPVGVFQRAPTGTAVDYAFIPLTDALGNEIGVSLSGVRTLRLTMVSGTAGMNINYFVLVPGGDAQPPFIAALSPAAGADNETSTPPISISIRNADTTVNTGSIQLRLDGTGVAPGITPTALGAEVNFTPSALSTGLHTVTLTFSDSASASITNEWQFRVANLAVRGHWTFNEQPPGGSASTAPGAILDVSGNARHGTATTAMTYAAGSFNYGNTRALTFTSGPDRVVVPDPAGSFNFAGSFTMEALVRTASSSTQAAILAKNGTGDGEGEYWWRLPGTAGGAQRAGVNSHFLNGTIALNDGQWHHVALVYDADAQQMRLYADYTLDATANSVVFDKPAGRPADLQIGGFIGTTTSEFDGDIDFIRISEGALSVEQFVQRTVALEPVVKSLRPANNAKNVSPSALIEAEFQNRDTAVELSALKLFIDGNDVTASATKTSDGATATIRYQPAAPLANGAHVATTIFQDTAVPANSWTNTWSFTVISSIPVAGLYQFNEKSPGEVADATPGAILDSSGNGRHGAAVSLNGIPYVTGSPEHGSSSALAFTVLNTNHIAVPDPTGAFNWNPTQSITMEAVIRTVNIGQASVGSILAKQAQPAPEWWWRINATGRQQFNVNDGSGGRSVSGTAILNDGQWHHVAVIYDGDAMQLRAYVDYAQDGATVTSTYTSTTSTIGNAQDLYIGRFQAGNRIFEGDMDIVRVTRAALDPSWFIPLGGLASQLQITDVVRGVGTISFSFATENGRDYVVESSGSVSGGWGDVETINGDGSVKTVTYATGDPQKYFRVRRQ